MMYLEYAGRAETRSDQVWPNLLPPLLHWMLFRLRTCDASGAACMSGEAELA